LPIRTPQLVQASTIDIMATTTTEGDGPAEHGVSSLAAMENKEVFDLILSHRLSLSAAEYAA
jgi:hypothetical protein